MKNITFTKFCPKRFETNSALSDLCNILEQSPQFVTDEVMCQCIQEYVQGMPLKLGTENYQIVRAFDDEQHLTYNHAPMLTAFQNYLLLSYITGNKSEHMPPSMIHLVHSKDGIHFSNPEILFPYLLADSTPYCGPKKELLTGIDPLICHHRMGFYQASNGILLAVVFYGFSPDFHQAPNNGYGACRIIREIKPDLTFSDMYVIRYNEPAGFFENNLQLYDGFSKESISVPSFTHSQKALQTACMELLNNPVVSAQWIEEERLLTHPLQEVKAISYLDTDSNVFHGFFKKGYVSTFKDGSWSTPYLPENFITNNAKVWANHLGTDTDCLIFNPVADGVHRWPAAMITSQNGYDFDGYTCINPLLFPMKYQGSYKNLGFQYFRGIAPCNPTFQDGQYIYVAYSENKEDIWLAKIPISSTQFPLCISCLHGLIKHSILEASSSLHLYTLEETDPFGLCAIVCLSKQLRKITVTNSLSPAFVFSFGKYTMIATKPLANLPTQKDDGRIDLGTAYNLELTDSPSPKQVVQITLQIQASEADFSI